jgi:hypothetical protein
MADDVAGPWTKYAAQPAGPWSKFSPQENGQKNIEGTEGTTLGGLAGATVRGLAPMGAGALAGGAIGGPPGAAIGAGAMGLTELAVPLYNKLADHMGLPKSYTPQEATDKLLDWIGVKRPTTTAERITEAAAGGAAGAGGMAKGAAKLAETMGPGIAKGVTEQLGARAGGQAVAGASGGAAQQGAKEEGLSKSAQIAAGVAGSLVPSAAGNVAGKALAPQLSGDVKKLLDAGVKLTPGQMGEKGYKTTEEKLRSVPVMGTGIADAEKKALTSWNMATANKALEPVGIKLPDNLDPHQMIAEGQKQLSAKYDQLLPNLTFTKDAQFHTDLQNLIADAGKNLPPDKAARFDQLIHFRIDSRVGANANHLTGEQLKQVQSELNSDAAKYTKSLDPADQHLGQMLTDASDALKDAVERQNPNFAPELKKIDQAYAMWVRVENAAANRSGSEGVFTPNDLLSAIKKSDSSTRKRQFAAGDSLLQDWAETGHKVIGSKVPDSGTAGRIELKHAIGGAVTGAASPHALLGGAGAIGAGRAMYTEPALNALRTYAQPGQLRAGVGGAMRQPIAPLPLFGPGPAAAFNQDEQ